MEKTGLGEYFSIRYYFTGDEKKIPFALDSYAQKKSDLSDVNTVLELSSIKDFFDSYDHVDSWSDADYQKYKKLSQNADKEVRAFFLNITEDTMVASYATCKGVFKDEYWKYFYRYKVYEKITVEHFKEIVKGLRMSPNRLLENKNMVERFDEQISEILKDPKFGARFIINFYLGEEKGKYYFPKSLTKTDKCNIVKGYINGCTGNAKILDLIINGRSKNSGEFEADAKLKYLAKKEYERLWKENTVPMFTQETTLNVSFSPENPVKEMKICGDIITAKYNSNWIKDNLDYPTLLNNFIYLFEYTDDYMRCLLTAGSLKQGILENLFSTQGNGIYQRGLFFETLNILSNKQMQEYISILNECSIYMEEIIKWFFENYLKEEFGVTGFACIMPKRSDSILSKYERVATVMDGVTKQFKLFCEEGEIDRELYEMMSGSVRFQDIPSLIKNKYAYASSKEILREMNDMLSEQSMFLYTEKTGRKYNKLYDLLRFEHVKPEELKTYNSDELNWLLERGAVFIRDGILELNKERIWILKELNDKGVICLQYKDSNILRKLIIEGEINVGSSLLSKPEWEYFNYVLNKAEFSNGLDLRNKYIHDTNSLDERKQQDDYIFLLKMFIILVIKINEEFCLQEKITKKRNDFYEL